MQENNCPNIKKILLALADHLNVKGIRGLANALGVKESLLYSWIRNGNIVDTGLILSKCPTINREWLKTGEGEMLQNKFKQFADARLRQMAEKRAAGNVVAEAQARYPTGSLALTAFEETLFYMLRDLPEEARKRVEKDIIMEWTAARRQKPT